MNTMKLRAGKRMVDVRVLSSHGRLFFQFPYNKKLMGEIKIMEGSQWHGYPDAPHHELVQTVFGTDKIWSVAITMRNAFQLEFLRGGDPYARWSIPPVEGLEFRLRHHKRFGPSEVRAHQRYLVGMTLARHYVFWAAEMRSGKTLAAIEIMERTTDGRGKGWWLVAPKSALSSVRSELYNWDTEVTPILMTYDDLKKVMANWTPGVKAPFGVFFDEAHVLKNPASQRSKAAYALATGIRQDYGKPRYWEPADTDPFVIVMTGSPAPKGPDDFWHQAEVAAPGFLREGKHVAFKEGLGLFEKEESNAGWTYQKKITWLDNEKKCAICGQFQEDHPSDHYWIKSVNEVDRLYRRMQGLTKVIFTRDCIDIAPRIYRTIDLPPLSSTLRAARMVAKNATRSAEAQILLRELSDGFQYSKDEVTGTRTVLEACSPKEEALQDILTSHTEDGRLVVYAGFQASVDKCVKVAAAAGWHVSSWDGRGQKLYTPQLQTVLTGPDDIINAFNDTETFPLICFVAQADSAGTGINLSVADEIVYYSNSFKSDSRIQSEARCDGPNKRGVMITDFSHLASDDLVRQSLKEKKDTQSIALGDLIRVLEQQEHGPDAEEDLSNE